MLPEAIAGHHAGFLPGVAPRHHLTSWGDACAPPVSAAAATLPWAPAVGYSQARAVCRHPRGAAVRVPEAWQGLLLSTHLWFHSWSRSESLHLNFLF